ncbi:Thiol:disulfide interchange protein DsbA precursor [Methyloligella halotolerans]|uniref:Thiol:disulfide interchange protein DsbA n=1 Tax=Methyloligella halotolerans TaxID=1177755 RepID=A0A1E2S3E5_9HYPH|nr:DsbA family protein [Methyloligella halotolerans]ODA68855.1 Thiol:disulfide interchange protein DsbA precursor [Methyloligella halotolerans]
MRKLPAILLLTVLLGCAGIVAFAATSGDRRLGEAISEHADEIYRGDDPVVSDDGGDVPVVLFTDFNCPDCRKAEPAINRLVKEKDGVRLIVKQLPILGRDSEIAARIALAADAQGKYWPLHKALFEARGRITQNRALRIAEDLGLDMDRLKSDANGDEVSATLAKTFLVADAIDVPGVPFMLVGDHQVLESDDLYGDLSAAVDEVRAKGCTAAC